MWISTSEMAAELNCCYRTLLRLRQDGVLLPGVQFKRLRGIRSPLLWNKDAVIEAMRRRTALREA